MRRLGPANVNAIAAAVLMLLLLPVYASAQIGVPSRFELVSNVQLAEVDSAARAHLERVDALLANEQWDEAVETLRQLMEDHGERMIQLAPGRYVSLRQYGHARIARLPAAAFQLYRDRLDPLARQWFADGVANRDRQLLGQVVESLFCTSYGDDALLALGELELERGNYSLARYHWERISPLLKTDSGRPLWQALAGADLDASWAAYEKLLTTRDTPSQWVAYPNTDLDLANVRARLALVSIFEGHWQRAALEVDVLRRLHPQAAGKIGGREANYAQRLGALLDEARRWPSPPVSGDWTTFAGNPRRNRNASQAFRLAGPAWTEPITLGETLTADATLARAYGIGNRRIAEDFEGLLSYHPIIVGERIYVANQQDEIYAYDLQTGQPAWQTAGEAPGRIYKPSRPTQATGHNSARNHLGAPRFTLSAADGKLLARLGPPATSTPQDGLTAQQSSYLVCLDLKRQGQLLWEAEPEQQAWAFEGTPVTDGRYAYVALRRSDVRPQAHVACYDMLSGRRLWQRYICAAETPARGQLDEVTHNLLTLDEGTLYFNTNLGAIAALDAHDGAVRWITLYPRVTKGDLAERSAYFYRDLTPCVCVRGTLYAAPADCHNILAIDALTGRLLWASELPVDVVHLLGVVGDDLIASGDRLWWIDAVSGKAKRNWPESEASDVRGYGRGLLAGDQVYFPTRRHIYVFPATGPPFDQTQEPILLAAHNADSGNLVLAEGHLLIASATRLFAFCEQGRRREQLEIEVSRHPRAALPQYQLARLEESHGDLSAATLSYRRAAELVHEEEVRHGRKFYQVIRENLFVLLNRRIENHLEQREPNQAATLVDEAEAIAATPDERLRVRLRRAEILLAQDASSEAIAAYFQIATDPELGTLTFEQSDDWSLGVRLHIQQTLSSLAREQSPQFLKMVKSQAVRLGLNWPLLALDATATSTAAGPPMFPLHLLATQTDLALPRPDDLLDRWQPQVEITSGPNGDGRFVWRIAPLASRPGPLPSQPPTLRLTLDDRSSGRRLWTHDFGDALADVDLALTVQGDRLFVLIDQTSVECFHAATGARLWESELELQKKGEPTAAAMFVVRTPAHSGQREDAAAEKFDRQAESTQLIAVVGGLVRCFDGSSQRLQWEVDLAESQSQRLVPWRLEQRGNLLAAYPARLYSPGEFRFAYVDPAAAQLVYRSQPLEIPSGTVQLDWDDGKIAVRAGTTRYVFASRATIDAEAGVTLNQKD